MLPGLAGDAPAQAAGLSFDGNYVIFLLQFASCRALSIKAQSNVQISLLCFCICPAILHDGYRVVLQGVLIGCKKVFAKQAQSCWVATTKLGFPPRATKSSTFFLRLSMSECCSMAIELSLCCVDGLVCFDFTCCTTTSSSI